jgi:hypothetical protein
MVKKKIWANFQRIIELFTQKIFTNLSKIWFWDQRSWIQKKPIPDPGSGTTLAYGVPTFRRTPLPCHDEGVLSILEKEFLDKCRTDTLSLIFSEHDIHTG